jgi:hypothetical protein
VARLPQDADPALTIPPGAAEAAVDPFVARLAIADMVVTVSRELLGTAGLEVGQQSRSRVGTVAPWSDNNPTILIYDEKAGLWTSAHTVCYTEAIERSDEC